MCKNLFDMNVRQSVCVKLFTVENVFESNQKHFCWVNICHAMGCRLARAKLFDAPQYTHEKSSYLTKSVASASVDYFVMEGI